MASASMQSWKIDGMTNGSHVVATLNESSSWALPYNFFADQLLRTGVIDDEVSCMPLVKPPSILNNI